MVATSHVVRYSRSSACVCVSGCRGGSWTRAITRVPSSATISKQHQFCPAENGSLIVRLLSGISTDACAVIAGLLMVLRNCFNRGPQSPQSQSASDVHFVLGGALLGGFGMSLKEEIGRRVYGYPPVLVESM